VFLDLRWGELASHVEQKETTAAKDGENGSSHEEESETVEEDMGEGFVGETRCSEGPSDIWSNAIRLVARCNIHTFVQMTYSANCL
jgi:hypothetical protein